MGACEGHRAERLPQAVPITSRIPHSLLTPTYTLLPRRGLCALPVNLHRPSYLLLKQMLEMTRFHDALRFRLALVGKEAHSARRAPSGVREGPPCRKTLRPAGASPATVPEANRSRPHGARFQVQLHEPSRGRFCPQTWSCGAVCQATEATEPAEDARRGRTRPGLPSSSKCQPLLCRTPLKASPPFPVTAEPPCRLCRSAHSLNHRCYSRVRPRPPWATSAPLVTSVAVYQPRLRLLRHCSPAYVTRKPNVRCTNPVMFPS